MPAIVTHWPTVTEPYFRVNPTYATVAMAAACLIEALVDPLSYRVLVVREEDKVTCKRPSGMLQDHFEEFLDEAREAVRECATLKELCREWDVAS